MLKLLKVLDGIDAEYIRTIQDAIDALSEEKEEGYVASIYYVGGDSYDICSESYWTYEIFDKSELTEKRISLGKSLYKVDLSENYTLYELMLLAGEEKNRVIRELKNTLEVM